MPREKIDSCEITVYSGRMGKYKTDPTLITETQQPQYSLNRQIFKSTNRNEVPYKTNKLSKKFVNKPFVKVCGAGLLPRGLGVQGHHPGLRLHAGQVQ